MGELLTSWVLIFGTCGVAVLQICVLMVCGATHRRIGSRQYDKYSQPQVDLATIIGRKTDLGSDKIVLFSSLTCSHCLFVLKGLSASVKKMLEVRLADKETAREIDISLERFPEFTFQMKPGKSAFDSLGVQAIPLLIRTDSDGLILTALQIDNAAQLNNITWKKNE